VNKLSLPLSERASFSTKDFPIPEQPNIPTGQNDDFHKEWLTKTFPGIAQHHLHVIIGNPFNLEIVPYSYTKVAFKE
jgi:hypothetical protein